MKKSIFFSLLLFQAGLVVSGQDILPVKDGDIYSIEFANVKFSVDASTGGRVSSFKVNSNELLYTNKPDPTLWGSVLWPSPQNGGDKGWGWPPSVVIDLNPYNGTIAENKIIVVSEKDPNKSGLQVKKAYWGNDSDTSITLEYTMINITNAAFKVAPWEVTRIPSQGLLFFPKGDNTAYGDLAEYYSLVDGNYWYEYDNTQPKNIKSFSDGSQGWAATLNENHSLFIKRFDDTPLDKAAPQEDEIELWNSDLGYIEFENQAAYISLAPGDSLVWKMRWYLRQISQSISAKVGNPALVAEVLSVLDTTSVSVTENKGQLSSVFLYPNPCDGNYLNVSGIGEKNAQIEVIDMAGKVIFACHSSGQEVLRLNNLDLSAGVYTIKINTENRIESKKLVVR